MSSSKSMSPTALITQPLLQNLLRHKAEHIIADWMQQFRILEDDRKSASSKPFALKTIGTSTTSRTTQFASKLWVVEDSLSKEKFYVGPGPKMNEMTDFYGTFARLDVSAVVNFARLHEGPLMPGGAADFADALYFPCTTGELTHFMVTIGDTTAEIVVTNTRMTMINDVVAVSDLDVDVNLNFEKPVLGSCPWAHTIEPRQSTMIQHIQHFNWPPDEPPWCTDSILQTLAELHRLKSSASKNTRDFTMMSVLLLCGDGCTRSGAFVALHYCVTQLSRSDIQPPSDLNKLVKEAVDHIRSRCADVLRNARIFIWLNYAVIEYCVKHVVESMPEKKESKKICEWLAKLRKAVYAFEKKSSLVMSLMG